MKKNFIYTKKTKEKVRGFLDNEKPRGFIKQIGAKATVVLGEYIDREDVRFAMKQFPNQSKEPKIQMLTDIIVKMCLSEIKKLKKQLSQTKLITNEAAEFQNDSTTIQSSN